MATILRSVRAAVTETGFDRRARCIRRCCRKGSPVKLRREPENPRDAQAIAVYLRCTFLLGLWSRWIPIGYLKSARADHLASKMDAKVYTVKRAYVHGFDADPALAQPRVSIQIEFVVQA